MELGKQQKTISLTAETVAMVAKKGKDWNFSGWIRARIRQMDEGKDLVEMELSRDFNKAQYKRLCFAVDLMLDDEVASQVFECAADMAKQASLGDFE